MSKLSHRKFDLIKSAVKDRTLSAEARCGYILALVQFLNDETGRCDPSQWLLAQQLGFSLRQVERGMAELRTRGAIVSRRRKQNSAALSFIYPYPQDPPPVADLGDPQDPPPVADQVTKTRQNRPSRPAKSGTQDPPPVAAKLDEENEVKRTSPPLPPSRGNTTQAWCGRNESELRKRLAQAMERGVVDEPRIVKLVRWVGQLEDDIKHGRMTLEQAQADVLKVVQPLVDRAAELSKPNGLAHGEASGLPAEPGVTATPIEASPSEGTADPHQPGGNLSSASPPKGRAQKCSAPRHARQDEIDAVQAEFDKGNISKTRAGQLIAAIKAAPETSGSAQ